MEELKSWKKERLERFAYLDTVESKKNLTTEEIDKLIYYGILESDPSANGYFIKPCLQTLGVFKVSKKVMDYYLNGNLKEKVGALKLFYWVSEQSIVMDYFEDGDYKEKEVQAIQNDKSEYKNRAEVLIPELLTCENPILKFFFKWALSRDDHRKKYFKKIPETSEALIESVRGSMYYNQLKELFPNWKLD